MRGEDKSHFGQRLVCSGGNAAPQHAAPPSRNTVPAPAPTLAVQRIHYAVVWVLLLAACAAALPAVAPLLLLLYPTPHAIIPTLPVLLVLPLPPPPGPHVCIICSLLLLVALL